MVERPFADRRPIGPVMDLNLDREVGDKIQLGVPGTSMPGVSKSPMNVLFVLEDHVATLPRDVDGPLNGKIVDKFDGTPRIKAKRSGPASEAAFDEQAIIVTLRSDSLPVQDAQIHNAVDSIERHYSDFGVRVRTVIMDTE